MVSDGQHRPQGDSILPSQLLRTKNLGEILGAARGQCPQPQAGTWSGGAHSCSASARSSARASSRWSEPPRRVAPRNGSVQGRLSWRLLSSPPSRARLSALCYAEFASVVPISGSAYTYSYFTLGELVAWIIGWDLILEYAVGNIAVAISWSGYMNQLLARFRDPPAFLDDDQLQRTWTHPRR